ncbi:MAG: ribulose-phosphate 3-epimerase [Candidatus Anoxymicrobium japonicum]|uniref:Ribulose-phosphate 3-epimerase n=1 Tax=Candidatus Anoxymicrobium japonicum TaxID=2013648 RepID=A0A2N3G667_9ACTN|nr:MAG: ribulose-phosphate 3-epimerase [Candidatus Anoxymicrobium japonicum]
MGEKVRLSPSILNADFSNLGAAIKAVEPFSDYIHMDVMDGHFVPNITFGPVVVEAVKRVTGVPIDAHLMIYNPPEWVETFAEAGADRISFHIRSCRDPESVLRATRALGVSPGLAISPEVPTFELKPFLGMIDFAIVMCVYPGFGGQKLMPEMLNRIGSIKRDASELGIHVEVEVDGGVNVRNLPAVLEAGADNVVVGSSIFSGGDIASDASEIKAILEGVRRSQRGIS